MRAVFRIAQDVDFAVDPDAQTMLAHWRATRAPDGRARFSLLDPDAVAGFSDHIEVMTPEADGAFRYAHHGEGLARRAGVKLAGRSTVEFREDVAAFFAGAYGLAVETGEVVYAINESALVTPVHAWRRFHFPFHDDDGRIACVLGLVRPTLERHQAWQAVSVTAGFGAGSLEPLRGPDGAVDDFLIIEAAGLAQLLRGRSPATLGELLGRALGPELADALQRAAAGERVLSESIVVDGSEGRRDFVVEAHGSAIGPILNMRDVTETAAAHRTIARRTEELKRAQMLGRIGSWSMDLTARTLDWSPELTALLRLDPATFRATPHSVNALYIDEDRQRAAEVQRRVLETGVSASLDVAARRGDGTTGHYTLEFSADLGPDGKVAGLFGTVQDMTERKEAELMLEKLAYFDPLTGLPNRAMFKKEMDHKLQASAASGRPFFLLLMDIDHFKDVNDTLGHGAGDMLLVRVARMLRQATPHDALVARLGGDEFAILYQPQGVDPTVEELASAIVMHGGQPILLDEGEVSIGVSIGIAEAGKDGATVAQLLKNADLALYSAKSAGRGRHHCYEAAMSGQAEERISLGRDLKKALADDALDLHFQPIVALGSRKVEAFEALLRWRHPTRGYVPPTEFIPIAESSSLICDLGFWVLNRACRTMKAWIDAGNAPLSISVNVSAAQFWQSSFEQEVRDILHATGLPPELLKLEVTESVFVDSGSKRVRDCFEALAALGIRLSIDDFGTGFSNLSYLSALPFSELKIDRTFVMGIDRSPERRKLLQGIVGLARGLDMSTVIEGAETAEEVLTLQGLGCNLVQGYFFARPQPFDAWAAMIAGIEGAPAALAEATAPAFAEAS
jgi:diguanylate cyclase (GGDEF)-like protein